MSKDKLMATLNALYKNDPLVNDIMNACGIELDSVDAGILQFINNLFFDTANAEGIAFYEREAGIVPRASQSLNDRRSALEAKWKSEGKVDIDLIQEVADSWDNGRVEVAFVEGKIQVTFTSEYGLPDDRTGVELALDEVKPAHLPIAYLVRYLLVRDVADMTVAELGTHNISEFAFRERN